MDTLSIILIAVGLSMDSFAVSITNGLTITNLTLNKVLTIAFSLSIFQATMPLLGWIAGGSVEKFIKQFDHWIAFFLLLFIGGKMIYDGISEKTEDSQEYDLKFSTLITQSIATSIDAFAVGISFAVLNLQITTPILIIGLVTFIASIMGLLLGKKFGDRLGESAEIIGGLGLIAIGSKILIEHIYF